MAHPYASYWNRGLLAVPVMTGAVSLMDAQDIPEICQGLGVDIPLKNVLDVGCGTARIAKHCDGYTGCDIAADAVAYARRNGLVAYQITGPDDLPAGQFDIVTCLSVFTHIDEAERVAYLRAFMDRTNRVIVDVIPGDGTGDVAMWTAQPTEFMFHVADMGWRLLGAMTKQSDEGITHRYYLLERRS